MLQLDFYSFIVWFRSRSSFGDEDSSVLFPPISVTVYSPRLQVFDEVDLELEI